MRALYCQSDVSFLELLKPMFEELDSLYWVVDCQSGPVKGDWIYESASHEQAFEDFHVSVPAFEDTSTRLWKPGTFSQVRKALYFDEWSYLIGFRASEAEAVDRATRFGESERFSAEFYDLLAHEGHLFAVQVDGWWEFYPATNELFSRIRDCTPCREIALRSRDTDEWTPLFL